MILPAVKRTVKLSAMRSMRSGGLYSLSASSAARKRKLLILCYHGIALRDECEWAGHLFITADRFAERLTSLRDLRANVLPLGEALDRLQKNVLPERAVAITFDDGFYDFRRQAAPLLVKFGFPATLYLTTYYSGLGRPIIYLILDYLLWKSGRASIDLPEQGVIQAMPLGTWDERQAVDRAILAWFDSVGLDTTAKDHFARRLACRLQIDYDEILRSRILQIMTPDEAAELAAFGVDVQMHTHRHRTPLDRALFLREISDNRTRIQAVTGKTPTHFCYPSGVSDPAFLPWLRECGVRSATTCQRGFARPETDLFLLPRVLDDTNMAPVEFEGIVSGLFA